MALASTVVIEATPRPGHTVDELQKVIDEEIAALQRDAPAAREVERALNQYEASFYDRMELVGGFGGKADQLNAYYTNTGAPDWFNEDLARYRSLSPTDISAAAAQFLPKDRRVELIVVPEGNAGQRR
jgi:zinc protease